MWGGIKTKTLNVEGLKREQEQKKVEGLVRGVKRERKTVSEVKMDGEIVSKSQKSQSHSNILERNTPRNRQ